jgi:hypothetical protein
VTQHNLISFFKNAVVKAEIILLKVLKSSVVVSDCMGSAKN